MHSNLRKALVQELQPTDQQYGGLQGGGTVFGVLTVKALFAVSKVTVRSVAALFNDIKVAFYTVVRQLVMQVGELGDELDREIAWVLQRLNVQPEAVQAMRALLQNDNLLQRGSVSHHMHPKQV